MSLGPELHESETFLGVAGAFDGKRVIPGDVAIRRGRIARLGVEPGSGELIAAPGFVDLQLNGFAGVDLQRADADEIARMGVALAATGVTAYQPTVITGPPARMQAALSTFDAVPSAPGMPHVLPAHLEGPFLSPSRHGAHPPEWVATPDRGLLGALLESGRVGFVTLAPELPAALTLVEELCTRGVVVSLGHSDATAEQADTSFDAGITAVTHAHNAMRPFAPRDPGPVAAALRRGEIWVTAIADGIHLHPTTLHLLERSAGDRFVAVSDAMLAAGLVDGTYSFGPLTVTLESRRATLPDGRLAGSAHSLDEGLRRMVAAGVPLERSLAAVSSRPAAVIGDPDLGWLRVGGPADLVVLDRDLRPLATYIAGVRTEDGPIATSKSQASIKEEIHG